MDISSIDLSKKNNKEIPYNKIDANINWLILSDNNIRRIDENIKKFKYLTRLALNDNKISKIDKNIGFCTGINWIDLTRNRLTDLPQEFSYLSKITGLGLSENCFEKIPEAVYKLKNLRKFGFFSNKVTFISPDIKFLKNLIKIDLSNNKIDHIPDELCSLINLSWLNLSNNNIKVIPKAINNLYKLEELGLGMNEIEEIPPISSLSLLRILPLFKNKIKKIDKSLFLLKSIEKLDFSDNFIEEFPLEAIYAKKLRYLNLRNNKISFIPSNLSCDNLSCINMIELSENLLKFIPFKLFKSFSESTTIRLANNPYKKLPVVIPVKNSLMQICFTKILSKNIKMDPWVNSIFKKKYKCDFCDKMFVVEPFYCYLNSYFESECPFVVEKTLCSYSCLIKAQDFNGNQNK